MIYEYDAVCRILRAIKSERTNKFHRDTAGRDFETLLKKQLSKFIPEFTSPCLKTNTPPDAVVKSKTAVHEKRPSRNAGVIAV